MTEDASLRHIDPLDAAGLALWSLVLGVPPDAVLAAVSAVGTDAKTVQAEIETRPENYKARVPATLENSMSNDSRTNPGPIGDPTSPENLPPREPDLPPSDPARDPRNDDPQKGNRPIDEPVAPNPHPTDGDSDIQA